MGNLFGKITPDTGPLEDEINCDCRRSPTQVYIGAQPGARRPTTTTNTVYIRRTTPKVPLPILFRTTLTTVLHYRADCDLKLSFFTIIIVNKMLSYRRETALHGAL